MRCTHLRTQSRSHREISRVLGVGGATVSEAAARARAAQLDWAAVSTVSDVELVSSEGATSHLRRWPQGLGACRREALIRRLCVAVADEVYSERLRRSKN